MHVTQQTNQLHPHSYFSAAQMPHPYISAVFVAVFQAADHSSYLGHRHLDQRHGGRGGKMRG
jgi:hypothetical protein